MSVTVSLRAIMEEVDLMMEKSHVFLNRKTGELVHLSDDELQAAEEENGVDGNERDQDDTEDMEDEMPPHPEWEQKLILKAKEVLSSGDYLALPDKFDFDEYRIMERFCYSLDDAGVRDSLARAIQGSGAFRRFKDGIRRHEVEKKWYAYHDEALRKEITAWCEVNDIELVP